MVVQVHFITSIKNSGWILPITPTCVSPLLLLSDLSRFTQEYFTQKWQNLFCFFLISESARSFFKSKCTKETSNQPFLSSFLFAPSNTRFRFTGWLNYYSKLLFGQSIARAVGHWLETRTIDWLNRTCVVLFSRKLPTDSVHHLWALGVSWFAASSFSRDTASAKNCKRNEKIRKTQSHAICFKSKQQQITSPSISIVWTLGSW